MYTEHNPHTHLESDSGLLSPYSPTPPSHLAIKSSLGSECISSTVQQKFEIPWEEDTDTQTDTQSESAASPKGDTLSLPSGKLTVVLDLDETLVHCSTVPVPDPDLVMDIVVGGQPTRGYVKYRPDLLDFLEFASDFFELAVFTASEQVYADRVLDSFDASRSLIPLRYYRDSCTCSNGAWVKDLRVLGRNLSRVVIADNSPAAFAFQQENGIPIRAWTSDPNDDQLFALYNLLKRIDLAEDVRPYVAAMFLGVNSAA